jgi:hypothetical protein
LLLTSPRQGGQNLLQRFGIIQDIVVILIAAGKIIPVRKFLEPK